MSETQGALAQLQEEGIVAPNPPDLAHEKDILSEFGKAIGRAGVVGEDRTTKVLFLAHISRFLPRPVSVAVKGPSGGGKSYTIDQVLSFLPASAYFERTAMSPRNLAYTKESFTHRHIVLFEAAGMGEDDDIGQYLIRSLLSEGRLLYEFVDQKKQDTVLIDKAGPTGLIISTTAAALHPENETRMLSLTVSDTREQTRSVLRQIARGANGAEDEIIDRKPWMELQLWLDKAEHRAVVPFASQLAERIEPEAVRLRRDFTLLVGLIQANAILHQLNRDHDAQGRAVASLEDYRAVYEIVADVVSEGIGTAVSDATRETVEAVATLSETLEDGVPLGALASHLKLDKSNVSRRTSKARYNGYLVNLEERKGRPARYKVGDPLPDPAKALPEPEALAESFDPHPPTTPTTPQHPPTSNGTQPLRATPPEKESAGQSGYSEDRCSVAGVSGGRGEVLRSTVADPPEPERNGHSEIVTAGDFELVALDEAEPCEGCGRPCTARHADGSFRHPNPLCVEKTVGVLA